MTRAREPIFNLPAVVLAVAAGLAAIHLGRDLLPEATDEALLIDFAFIPVREISWLVPGPFGESDPHPWAFLTYALLHQGVLLHLAINLIVLSALGTPVARRLGQARFLTLLAGGALCRALGHFLLYWSSGHPPCRRFGGRLSLHGRRRALRVRPGRAHGGGAPGLIASLRNRSVITFVLAWFFANAVSAISAGQDLFRQCVDRLGGASRGLFSSVFSAFRFFDRAPQPAAEEMAQADPSEGE